MSSPGSNAPIPVSELVLQIRKALEQGFPLRWVVGEVSNLTRAASGHVYFTLRDDTAQVRCVMWRNRAQLLPFRLDNGMRIEARAWVTVYEPRGDLQLSVEALRQAGQGSLFEAFLRLKARLDAEGLFDPARKRALPAYPRAVGVVTSPAAAALRDVLTCLGRRAPHLAVVLYPCPVQGEGAGVRIAEAIALAGRRAALDGVELLLVCRGGGSLEDLWAFNDEAVVRAIAASPLPVISGVGHETDVCLSDFAADLRAATPTAAAEAASAGFVAARQRLEPIEQALARVLEHRLHAAAQRLDALTRRLVHPRQALQRQHERLDQLQMRLRRAAAMHLQAARSRYGRAELRLSAHRPATTTLATRLVNLTQRLDQARARQVEQRRATLERLQAQLALLDPQAVLERGYAVVRNADGQVLRNAAQIADGGDIAVQLARGRLTARVTEHLDDA